MYRFGCCGGFSGKSTRCEAEAAGGCGLGDCFSDATGSNRLFSTNWKQQPDKAGVLSINFLSILMELASLFNSTLLTTRSQLLVIHVFL